MSLRRLKPSEDPDPREEKRRHLESVKRSKSFCTLCPPHRLENRTNRKRNAGQKPTARGDARKRA